MLYSKDFNPFTGLAESIATSASFFLGDASGMLWSLTTEQNTASRFTLQGNLGNGFTAALDAADWYDLTGVTLQGLYSIDSGGALSGFPRWGRFQRVPSNTSTTFRVSYQVRG